MRNNISPLQPIGSVHRALTLLSTISEEGSLTVTHAAEILNVHPSTAQRLLATLAHSGYARQDSSRRYLPGAALFRLPKQLTSARQLLRPYLEQLHELTSETIHLATLVGTEVDHPDAIESQHALRFGLRTGVRIAAHITSEGKSLLASLPWSEVESRYSLAFAGKRASNWNIDFGKLRTELARVRQLGYATNFEESEPGIAGMSIMVGVVEGEYCTISVAIPISRFSDNVRETLIGHLYDTVMQAREDLQLGDPYQELDE